MATGNGVHDDAQSRHPGQIRLGITGGIGSGKSYVAQMLQACWDVPVYDCDSEAKRLTAESDDIRTALTQLVGDHLWQQGQMQKPVLATYLFASPEHAAQVMPVTTNFSCITPPPYFISFCSVVTSSSMTASSP